MRNFTVAALTTILLCGVPFAARAGTITKLTASPAVVVTGQTVTFTEDGTNPCGAANLNYGDGIVITYPITGLPAQQTHAFEKAGTYTVIVRGMGNCDGETTTTVQVKPAVVPPPPPPPAPTAPRVSALSFAPSQGIAREPVMITVDGAGLCRFAVRFGDGNSRELSLELPNRVQHTYAVPGTYTVVVAPMAPCSGRFTERLTIDPRPGVPRVVDLAIEPSISETGTATLARPRFPTVCGTTILRLGTTSSA
jgi:hypothetical protein